MMARRVMAGRGGFSPKALFAAGEQGVWYDPSDFSTLFQSAEETVPVTAVEQPVGLMLDKSKGLVLGSELVTNGNFDSDLTGWSYNGYPACTWENGSIKVTGGVGTGGPYQDITYSGFVKITIRAKLQQGSLFVYIYNKGSFGSVQSNVKITSGEYATYTLYARAVNGGARIYLQTASWYSIAYFDSISARVVAGNHAFQTTRANRPTLSARVNLLTKTEAFDDAAWTKYNVTTPNSTTIKDDTSTSYHYIRYNGISLTSGTAYKLQVRLEKGTVGFAGIHFYDNAAHGCSVNLTTGQLGSAYGGATATAVADGTGWILAITATAAVTTAIGQVAIYMSTSNALTTYSGTGNGTIYASNADLRVANDGVGIPAYQRVNTATDYDTTGFPLYLSFNGSNQWMQTNAIDFSGTDKMTMFAGVRKLSDEKEVGIVASQTTATDYFYLGACVISGAVLRQNWGIASKANFGGTTTAFAAPDTRVITGLYDLAQTTPDAEMILRVNGTQQNLTFYNADHSSGQYYNVPLYIGAVDGTVNHLNGRLYSIIVRGAQSSANLITAAERYVARKTGVTL